MFIVPSKSCSWPLGGHFLTSLCLDDTTFISPGLDPLEWKEIGLFFWSTTRTHTSCYIILGLQGVLTAITTHWAPPTFLSHAGPQWQQYIKAFLQDRLLFNTSSSSSNIYSTNNTSESKWKISSRNGDKQNTRSCRYFGTIFRTSCGNVKCKMGNKWVNMVTEKYLIDR